MVHVEIDEFINPCVPTENIIYVAFTNMEIPHLCVAVGD